MTNHPATVPGFDEARCPGDGEISWNAGDGATWRGLALGLLEMELRRGHLARGWDSIVQYADYELSLPAAEVEELLRIGRKLLDLPEIDRALRVGWLAWEHVVALTKVAVPGHELAWLSTALGRPLEDLTRLVECSAEGWAPPVAWAGEAQACEAARGASIADVRATYARGRAPDGEGRFRTDPRGAGRIVAAHALGAPGRSFRRHLSASSHWVPNVRQPFHAPPSTS
jgi:hypothetical protein